MEFDGDYFRARLQAMSPKEFRAIAPSDLNPEAQQVYEIERVRRESEPTAEVSEQLPSHRKDRRWYVVVGVLAAAWVAVGTMGRFLNSTSRLIEKLADADGPTRNRAARQLGASQDRRAVEPLISALLRGDDSLRTAAAVALGDIGDDQSIDALTTALKDSNGGVRRAAADALGKIGGDRVFEPLILALGSDDSVGYGVKTAAARALALSKDLRAVEPLIVALDGGEKGSDLRLAAVRALGECGKDNHRAVERLDLAIADDHLRVAAIDAMVKIGPLSIEPLLRRLTDWQLRGLIGDALMRIGWTPRSDSERVHFQVARGDGQELREGWTLTKEVLLSDLAISDYRRAEYALYALIAIGRSEIIEDLSAFLETKGSVTVAEAYINSGNSALRGIAESWALRNGYRVSLGTGNAPVGWARW